MFFASQERLLMYSTKLSGYSVREIADSLAQPIPRRLTDNKGFVGKLLELILGVPVFARNNKCVDFPDLGIELKSILIDNFDCPLEPTFICSVPTMENGLDLAWKNSYFYKKIQKILWIPIKGSKNTCFLNKIVGKAFIWTMNEFQEEMLKQDWEGFMDLISVGKISGISSQCGNLLQIKTKCKNSRSLTEFVDYEGNIKLINPKAFYFKKKFTQSLLNSS